MSALILMGTEVVRSSYLKEVFRTIGAMDEEVGTDRDSSKGLNYNHQLAFLMEMRRYINGYFQRSQSGGSVQSPCLS